LVISALDLARIVNNQSAYGQLYQALAIAYNYWGKPDSGVGYARIAYGYYKRKNNKPEAGRASYNLAVAYQALDQPEDALQWINIATTLLVGIETPQAHAVLDNLKALQTQIEN
jgi:tetratricopeptide (TPR) repeat protein